MLNNSVIRKISLSVQSKQKLAAKARVSVEEQAKQNRARGIEFSDLLWAVQNCEPGTTPAPLSFVMAGRLIALAKFMSTNKLLDRLDRLPANMEAARFLMELIRASVKASQEDIADELEQVDGPGDFKHDLNFLLHGHLRKSIYPDEWSPHKEPLPQGFCHDDPVEEVDIGNSEALPTIMNEEWMPPTRAVQKLSCKRLPPITLSLISKHKHHLRTRPKMLAGRHSYEIEFKSLAVWCVCRMPSEPQTEDEEDRDIGTRFAAARAAKSKGRLLD